MIPHKGIFVAMTSLLLVPGYARAETPSLDAVAASLTRFDEGRAAFEARRFDDARAAFEASHALQASPNSLLYIARCYRETGRVASAYVTFRRAAREAQDRLTATMEKRFGATRDAASAEAAELDARVPRFVVAVPSGLPRDFKVTLDKKAVPAASWGLAIEVDPGEKLVEASGARMRPFQATVTLTEGDRQRVDVVVEPLPTATLSLTFKQLPVGIQVALDGLPLDARDAARAREVDVGRHRLEVGAPGYLPWVWDKPLQDREFAQVAVDLAPNPAVRERRGTAPWVFFTAAGSAAIAAGVGAAFALNASSLDSREASKNPLVRDSAVRDVIRAQSTIANVFLVSGAVLGASAAVLLFTTHWRSQVPHRNVSGKIRVNGGLTHGFLAFDGAF